MTGQKEQYLYLMSCEVCKGIDRVPDEAVRSLIYTRAVKCQVCGYWNVVPQWLKDAVRRDMQCKK